ncbi:MAG: hypothetical protein KDA78_00360 [Planctomycetaceae bacterium]|nr:hypothetical protein [Planctomycetaceae bacterium]
MPLRSGRFSFKNGTQTIIKGKNPDAIFRVLNSGDELIKVDVDGTTVELNPKYSIDIAGGDLIQIVSDGNKLAQGMYDYLSEYRDIRSGRFNTINPRKNKVVHDPLLIIDYSLASKSVLFYRFFNSSDDNQVINIYVTKDATTLPSGSPDFVLNPEQSIDLQCVKSGSKGAIWVKSNVNNKPIDGIYDYLGSGK